MSRLSSNGNKKKECSPPKTENVDSGVDIKTCTSPLAFTVNFDEDREEEDRKNNNKKLLNLKDSIKRFSPKNRVPSRADKTSNESKKDDDRGSETGTYTIEDEDESEEKRTCWNSERLSSRDEDWISHWAEEQVRQQQKLRQDQHNQQKKSGASSVKLDNSDENCRFRRKLPRLPPPSNHSNDSRETEDLLKDTLSVMNAMEARIEDSTEKKKKRNLKPVGSLPLSSSSSLKNEKILRAKKPVDPKEAAKISELEAWKRRKNYRPTPLSATPTKIRGSVDRIASAPSANGGLITRAALRQQSKSVCSKKNGIAINGKGGASNGRSTSSMSSKDAEFQAWKRRKNYNPLQAVADSKKKNQANSTCSSSRVSNSLETSTVTAGDFEDDENALRSLQGLKVSDSSTTVMPPRSASFHYPEGKLRLSSSHLFTSEDEDEESLDFEDNISAGGHMPVKSKSLNQRKLLSELGSSSESTVRLPTAMSVAAGGKNPHKSHQKLEALDNLVISTIFSVSTKLCITSLNLLQKVRTSDLELSSIIDTLLYILDDTDPPVSPSKKTSRELSGTLRNLKKVEQVLQVMERLHTEDEDDDVEDD